MIIGRACRFPGAPSIAAFWRLLRSQGCAVSEIPASRWSRERFGHPRQGERGKSYTWAAGVLDDIWGFDPSVFGISPREAEQMDPQQRLMLELTWEALEDAGIPPSRLAGSETGVFVGASALDYGHSRTLDIASTDAYFATGNALSIISNRISHVFDLHGPSFTVDTACSSSLVALYEAVQAIGAGRIDTAIVGGVNILASPFGFTSFSQASMLSRTGLCRAFSAKADGYVRAEGGAVLVLRSRKASEQARNRRHAMIVGAGVNSDGRTNNIALPSSAYQARLLDRVYSDIGADPDRLAFVEAHGTGTKAGDPAEASAIGAVLGRRRLKPLPIGSVKTNIGHAEAASGLAGLLKAMLALEHNELPPSLHAADLNPDIDFDGLNINVCRTPLALDAGAETRLAGVSSFGFGGTNAHVVLADAPVLAGRPVEPRPKHMILTALSRPALSALADAYADRLAEADHGKLRRMAAAAGHHRERMPETLVIPVEDRVSVVSALRAIGRDEPDAPGFVSGRAVEADAPTAFVYTGNGGRFSPLWRLAHARNRAFRDRFLETDALFKSMSGSSLTDWMHRSDFDGSLRQTSVVQPMIFAIQSATTFALREQGLAPDFVFGHSVGEVAAAEAAGAVDLKTAVKIIHFRSLHQESTHRTGAMTVVFGPRNVADELVALAPDAVIAAYNSPRSFTISGSLAAIELVEAFARARKTRVQRLDLPYPFHSALMEPVEQSILADLGDLALFRDNVPLISTVTGKAVSGFDLDAGYWWRNIRQPVLFQDTVLETFRLGARVFVEIGPNPILASHVGAILESAGGSAAVLRVFDREMSTDDPCRRAAATAFSRGSAPDADAVFGPDPGPDADLPLYPWRKTSFEPKETIESASIVAPRHAHPLIGARMSSERCEWLSHLDTTLMPDLADHKVGSRVVLPGSGFVEMALAVARDWLQSESATVADIDIVLPMTLSEDALREVKCRLSPSTQVIEIMSRRRLGQTPWQTHATAKIVKGVVSRDARPAPKPSRPRRAGVSGGDLHRMAESVGLVYGPAFRRIDSVSRIGPDLLMADLLPDGQDPRFGLDPAILDACFQAVFALFAGEDRMRFVEPYIPVHFGEVRLLRPRVPARRARIDILRFDESVILADLTLFDADGTALAVIDDARFQATKTSRSPDLAGSLVMQTSVPATEPTAARGDNPLNVQSLTAAARTLRLIGGDAAAIAPDVVLTEAWAIAAALEFVRGFAGGTHVSRRTLSSPDSLPGRLRPWRDRIVAILERRSILIPSEDGWTIADGVVVPDPDLILRALAAEHPGRWAELLIGARATAMIRELAGPSGSPPPPLTPAAVDGFETGGQDARTAAETLAAVLAAAMAAWPKDRAVRVLQIGDGPLTGRLAALWRRHHADLTILETEQRRFERATAASDADRPVNILNSLEHLPAAAFDVVIAAGALRRTVRDEAAWSRLGAAMAPGGVIAAIEPSASLFAEVAFGLDAALSADDAGRPFAAYRPPGDLMPVLRDAALIDTAVHPVSGGIFCLGQKPMDRRHTAEKRVTLIVSRLASPRDEIAAALPALLAFSGVRVATITESELGRTDVPDAQAVIYLAPAFAETLHPVNALTARCLALKRLASAIGSGHATLWIVSPGATRSEGGLPAMIEAGFWAFTRTLANETRTLDIRRIDLEPGLPADVSAKRLRDVALSGTRETEIVLDKDCTRVVRFARPDTRRDPTAVPAGQAIRLEKSENSKTPRLRWCPADRRAPAVLDVEIAVEAAGVNFRDVMWSLSLLPRASLEHGFSGADLGMECAGLIVRVGAGVGHLAVGDRVLALAPSAYATEVTVPASIVEKIPDGLSTQAAAGIPVAFLTAYYALVTCARLKRGDSVLIHGGAGAVGMAAIQIAHRRGAHVLATAGSVEKRDLLRSLGVRHVFDSRSVAFVEDLRAIRRAGVDVVLNSLSGESMERGIGVLKPFGRFVELGKRDYVSNTHVGLKPFQRNLSYFGVDLDQLVLENPELGRSLLRKVMKLFRAGDLHPLPFRVFAAHEVAEGFRLMQQSGHVGKIIVTPPVKSEPEAAAAGGFPVSAERTHLITGGLGGFGLETARWLVDRGARHLMLVGRSEPGETARAALAEFSARGVDARVAAADVGDAAAVESLFEMMRRAMPPLAGVFHAAMVLGDGLIANLDAAAFERVLHPKVAGALHLDWLTRTMALDHFILFSSATTLFGNPGQGAYVAANAFMEGLARQRRRSGLPGTAIAWGALRDVGVLARAPSAQQSRLAMRAGLTGMSARDALDLMKSAIEASPPTPEHAVLAVAAMNWSTAEDRLPVLRSPTFADLARGRRAHETGGRAAIDVAALVAAGGPAEAIRQVSETIADEIARILRLPRPDVPRTRPLAEIGLDSLMAVELGLGLEERLSLDGPLGPAVSGLTLTELAEQIVGRSDERDAAAAAAESLSKRHLSAGLRERIDAATVETIAAERARRDGIVQ